MKRLSKFSLGIATLVIVLFSESAVACPVCFGEAGSAEVEGAKWAILFLLGVTGTVLSAVVSFILYVRKRTEATLAQPTHVHMEEL